MRDIFEKVCGIGRKEDGVKEKIIRIVRFCTNPRLLVSIGIAWFITNGWSYVMFGLGTILKIRWMIAVGGAYLTFLWLPVSPEKIVTLAIAIAILRKWFPEDEKTVAVLDELREKAILAVKEGKARRAERRLRRKAEENPA